MEHLKENIGAKKKFVKTPINVDSVPEAGMTASGFSMSQTYLELLYMKNVFLNM